jgi:hypothetical protein
MANAKQTEMLITSIATIPMPEKPKSRKGGNAKYPFNDLAVGQAFGVKGKTAKQMSGVVRARNRSNTIETTDAEGKVVNVEQTAEFFAIDVADLDKDGKKAVDTNDALKGSTVLVFRCK